MSQPFSFKSELLAYKASGQMSRPLFDALSQLNLRVLSSKGIYDTSVQNDVFSAFLEKILKFKSVFYTKMLLYDENQVRAFLNMTLRSVLIDYFRREKLDRLRSLDALDVPEILQPETTWNAYKLEAYGVYRQIWSRFSEELRDLFCRLYSGGQKLEDIARDSGCSVGKVHKSKKQISQLVAPEASIEEVAQMVYRLIALEFCCAGSPRTRP